MFIVRNNHQISDIPLPSPINDPICRHGRKQDLRSRIAALLSGALHKTDPVQRHALVVAGYLVLELQDLKSGDGGVGLLFNHFLFYSLNCISTRCGRREACIHKLESAPLIRFEKLGREETLYDSVGFW